MFLKHTSITDTAPATWQWDLRTRWWRHWPATYNGIVLSIRYFEWCSNKHNGLRDILVFYLLNPFLLYLTVSRLYFYFDHFKVCETPWTGDQLVARPLPKHRTTQIQKKTQYIPNIHTFCGIRTHDPGFRASGDSIWLPPLECWNCWFESYSRLSLVLVSSRVRRGIALSHARSLQNACRFIASLFMCKLGQIKASCSWNWWSWLVATFCVAAISFTSEESYREQINRSRGVIQNAKHFIFIFNLIQYSVCMTSLQVTLIQNIS
jgi:hypothetical protein